MDKLIKYKTMIITYLKCDWIGKVWEKRKWKERKGKEKVVLFPYQNIVDVNF